MHVIDMSNLRSSMISFLLVTAALCGIQFADTCRAATIRIPLDYDTIQKGVDAASGGDTLFVSPGIYSNTSEAIIDGQNRIVNARISKELTLIAEGPGRPVIEASASDVAIYVANGSVTIEGFEIFSIDGRFGCVGPLEERSPAQPIHYPIAIRLDGGLLTVRNCVIHNFAGGIAVSGGTAYIRENDLDILASGILLRAGSNGEVTDNSIIDCGVGVECDSSGALIVGNKFSASSISCVGVALSGGQATISGNSFSNLGNYGVLAYSSSAVIEKNRFNSCFRSIQSNEGKTFSIQDNLLVGQVYGIELHSFNVTSTNYIERNTFDNGSTALYIVGAAATGYFRNNIVAGHTWGLSCAYSASMEVSCNDFFEVTNPISGCPGGIGMDGNFSLDPEFCGISGSGNYYLQSDSPCAPGNHPDGVDCGRIGAFDVMCNTTPARAASWGQIKALYEGE